MEPRPDVTCDDRRDLFLLYAADALDPAEQDELRRHLSGGCIACAGHSAEAQATWAAVALELDPVEPAAALRQALMDRVAVAVRPPGRPGSGGGRWLFPTAAAAALVAAFVTYGVVVRHDRRALADERLSYNADARAVLLQAALADRDQTVEQLRRKLSGQQDLVEALHDPATRLIELAGAAQKTASARLVWEPAAGRSVLLATGLAAPPSGRTFELWFITADQRKVRAATFAPDAGGSALVPVPVPPGLATLAVAAVTDEPAGGSASPTGTIQLAGKAP